MELLAIYKHLLANYKYIFGMAVLFGLVGLISYFVIPAKYETTGSFYISRTVENSNPAYFSYEGYYSQQTALNYTNSFYSLIDSLDMKKASLDTLQIQPTEESIRDFSKNIRIKKAGPQIVTLSTFSRNSDQSKKMWEALAESALSKSNELNASTDPNLQVAKISQIPVTKQTFSNIFVNIFIGLGIGFGLAVANLVSKIYLKEI